MSGILRILVATVTAVGVLLAIPGSSLAGCGGTQTAAPAHHPKGQLPPLALGDSTMLLSLPGLASRGYDANAHGCRQFFQALQLLGQLRAHGRLPHMVTIALGANGSVTRADIDQALHILGPDRLLVLVTPREEGGGSGQDAVVERQAARADPRQVILLDWVSYSAGHRSWFQPDGLHLTWPGVYAFTGLLARAMPYAYVVGGC